MTEYKKRPIEHCKLEAIIFVYLLIIAMLCVHNYNNWPLLTMSLLALLPIKVLSTWFKVGQVFIKANYTGEVSDLIIYLGQEGFAPKAVGTRSYIFTTSLCLFPTSWCIIKHDGVQNILIATSDLITRLSAKTKHIQLINKSNIGIKKSQQDANPGKRSK